MKYQICLLFLACVVAAVNAYPNDYPASSPDYGQGSSPAPGGGKMASVYKIVRKLLATVYKLLYYLLRSTCEDLAKLFLRVYIVLDCLLEMAKVNTCKITKKCNEGFEEGGSGDDDEEGGEGSTPKYSKRIIPNIASTPGQGGGGDAIPKGSDRQLAARLLYLIQEILNALHFNVGSPYIEFCREKRGQVPACKPSGGGGSSTPSPY